MTVTPPVHTMPPAQPLRTDPITALLEAIAHVANLDGSIYADRTQLRLTAYHDALCSLAGTYGDNAQRVYDRAAERLPTGTLLKDATSEELRVMTLAMYGVARDRLTSGTRSRTLTEWRALADEAIHLYQQPRAA